MEKTYHKIREIRLSHGLKANYVAQKMGISLPTLYHYEQGKKKPTLEFCVKLAKLYGVSITEFV